MAHSSSRLPPLEALRVFEAAARLGSFSAAGEELNVTHGAVSRQIARLETWLGYKVFDRHARGVVTTPAASVLLIRTVRAFALIAESGERWLPARGAAVVRLTALPSFASRWLFPRLAALEAGDPALLIDLVVEERVADLAEEGVDLAIRWGEGPRPGRVGMELVHDRCHPVASPALAAALGEGRAERLLDAPLIHDSDIVAWRSWFRDHGVSFQPRRQDRRFHDHGVVLTAVEAGLGIALGQHLLVEDALAAGRLVSVDMHGVPVGGAWWMDRAPGKPRAVAATLATRISAALGVVPGEIERFLGA